MLARAHAHTRRRARTLIAGLISRQCYCVAMTQKITRLIGTAGSGKTAWLMETLNKIKEERRISPYSIVYTSFTRAARLEASSRAASMWGIDSASLQKLGWWRTTHSTAYKLLGDVEMLPRGGRQLTDWLSRALGQTTRAITGEIGGGLSVYDGGRSPADYAMTAWHIARLSMLPVHEVLSRQRRFDPYVPSTSVCVRLIERYERQKSRDGLTDYTDLLMRWGGVSQRPGEAPTRCAPQGDDPEDVRVLVVDECQDASALVAVCQQRIQNLPSIEEVYLAGDPWQSIYGWSGSRPSIFLEWPGVTEQVVMPRSWRCPEAVFSLGQAQLRRQRSGYTEYDIKPAGHEGSVRRCGSPAQVARLLSADSDTLVLARTHRGLEPWRDALRKARVPFSSTESDDAQQLRDACLLLRNIERGQVVQSERLAAAIDAIPAKLLERGVKAAWKRGEFSDVDAIVPGHLEAVGLSSVGVTAIQAGTWVSEVRGATEWAAAAREYGEEVATRPRVRLSTIHAAKGLEADTVVLSTSSSRRIQEAASLDRDSHDEECRVSYVAVTRARRNLIITGDPLNQWRMRV